MVVAFHAMGNALLTLVVVLVRQVDLAVMAISILVRCVMVLTWVMLRVVRISVSLQAVFWFAS
jgi:hypothetical protein